MNSLQGVQEDSDENEVDIKPKNDAHVKVEEGSVLEAPKKDDDAFSVEDPNIDQSDHYPRNWGELKDLSMSEDRAGKLLFCSWSCVKLSTCLMHSAV